MLGVVVSNAERDEESHSPPTPAPSSDPAPFSSPANQQRRLVRGSRPFYPGTGYGAGQMWAGRAGRALPRVWGWRPTGVLGRRPLSCHAPSLAGSSSPQCWNCGGPGGPIREDGLFCPQCRALQPPDPTRDHFSLMDWYWGEQGGGLGKGAGRERRQEPAWEREGPSRLEKKVGTGWVGGRNPRDRVMGVTWGNGGSGCDRKGGN